MITHRLRDTTLKLLRERPANIKLVKIAEDTTLPLTWLKKFHSEGEKYSPSGSKLETLFRYLSGREVGL